MAIDLHIHSTCSDGSCSPNEIIEMASDLKAISITDHDTMAAYQTQILQQNKVRIIPGIEITTYSPYEIHLLGYFIEGINKNVFVDIHRINTKRTKDILSLTDYFYHSGKIMISMGQIVKKYKHLSLNELFWEALQLNNDLSVDEFYFDRHYLFGKTIGISYVEAISLLKRHKAITSFAHPNRVVDMEELSSYKLIMKFKESGGECIECYHESMTDSDTDKYLNIANNNNLLITGGSDFHGVNKPHVEIGKGRGNLNVPDKVLEKLLKRGV